MCVCVCVCVCVCARALRSVSTWRASLHDCVYLIPVLVCRQGGTGEAKSFTHYEPTRNAGPQSDRVAAMKAAFSVSTHSVSPVGTGSVFPLSTFRPSDAIQNVSCSFCTISMAG